jgi:hypothetical protein
VHENVSHAAEAAIALAPTQTVEFFGRVAIEELASGAAISSRWSAMPAC